MILVAGEALIDLTSTPGAAGFHAHPGGGPCNTAVALGRLGAPVTFLGAVGDDGFGETLMSHLTASGVGVELVARTPRPTTLAIATVDRHGQADYAFYMDGTSAAQLRPGLVPTPPEPEISAIHVGTLGLVLEPTATSIIAMVVAEAPRRVIAVDPNIRSAVIPDMDAHRARLDTVLRRADVVRLSEDDALLLHPDRPAEATAAAIGALGPRLVVLSRGGAGVLAIHGDLNIERPVPDVEVVDTIGAGDSFNAGLLTWLHDRDMLSKQAIAALTPDQVAAAVDFASAVAAVTVSRAGANPPWRTELAGDDRSAPTDHRP